MLHKHLGLAGVSAALALLAACASGIPLHESQQEERDRFAAYSGEPIDHFTWLGRYDGWEPIGRYELVVFTGVNDAYLLKVMPPCENLQFANRIGISSTTGTVYSRLDSVIAGHRRCPIAEIRKIDYQRMKADRRAQR